MEDTVFQHAFTKFRDEINIVNLIKDIRVTKAAVQSKVTEEQWKETKKNQAIKPLWIRKKQENSKKPIVRRRAGISMNNK